LDRFFESKRAPALRLYTLKNQPIIATGWVLRAWEKFLLPLYILKLARYQEKTVYRKKQFTELFAAPEAVLKMSLVFYEKNLDYIRPIYRELKDRYGKRLEFSLFKNGLEITAKNIDKGKALMQLAAQHGIEIDEVAVVGDDANDIPMFQLFPQSFAMGHGIKAAKTAAKYELKQFSDLEQYLR
jgi:HAD superfamily hydrolase (TIGR01484 family)